MNTQIFPNWCKKLGLIIFIIAFILSGGDGLINGFNGYPNHSVENSDLFLTYFGGNLIHALEILTIIGMIIYMLSREKIEDDYINKLRLESFQLTAVIALFFTIILYAFSKELRLTLDYFIFLFIWSYLFVFFIKKRFY
jgi:Ca2+/Na+ antiporter